jgi:hypothetical protein
MGREIVSEREEVKKPSFSFKNANQAGSAIVPKPSKVYERDCISGTGSASVEKSIDIK